jgi:hypothetical protein
MGAITKAAGTGGESTAPRLGVNPVQVPIRLGNSADRVGTIGVLQLDQSGAGVGYRAVAIVNGCGNSRLV